MKFIMVMKRAIAEYNDYYNNKRLGGLLLISMGYKNRACMIHFSQALFT